MKPFSIAGQVCLLLAVVTLPVAAQLRTQLVVQGLSSPVAFVPDPTSATRFFIVQQGGLIRVFDGGVLQSAPLLDLRGSILTGGEQGLLGMAFAPDAAITGRFFVNFTSPSGDIVVARFHRSPASAPVADPTSRVDLIWPGGLPYIPHPGQTNHNGGHLSFGPDGYLYIGTGDGGGGNDPLNNAQNPQSLLGKMLRIDVNVPDGHPTGYEVPATNPFRDAQPIPALGEIWDFGLRNPWRYSFDDVGAGATGALLIGDVGQGAREEVDYEPAGAGGRNYGWSIREGTIATPGITTRVPSFQPLTPPMFDYLRTVGRAVTGGYVYRGTQLPAAYRGRYFVADSSTSVIGSVGIRVDSTTGEAAFVDAVDHTAELGGSLGGIVSFGRDRDGELYLVTFSGRVLKLVGADTPGPPASLQASVSGRTVSLTWMPPTTGGVPTGYRLEAGSSPGAANVATLATGPTTALTVTEVPDGTYFVRVRAERSGTLGAASSDVQVVVAACPVPAAPTNVTHAVAQGLVTIDWAAPATGAATYVVEAAATAGGVPIATLSVGGATMLRVPAPPGIYFVRVRAFTACGAGPASTEMTVRVP
jgi:glucose/arabinose dehydrogenase